MSTTTNPDAEATVAAADRAAEALREIAHAAHTDEPFDISTLYRTVAEVTLIAQRLPDVVRLVAGHVERRGEQFDLHHDQGGDVDATIREIIVHLEAAVRGLTNQTTSDLGQVHNLLSHLADSGTHRDS